MTILAGGLLVAYATFPRAGGEPEPTTRHVALPTRPPDAATVPPLSTAEAAQEPERAAWPPPPAPKEGPKEGTEQVTREAIGAGAPYPPLASVAETPRMTAERPLFGVPEIPAPRPPSVQQGSAPKRPSHVVGAAAQQQATLSSVDAPAATPPHGAFDGGFVPVLFTHKEQATVKRAFFELKHHFPTVLQRRQAELQAVDMGEKGVWHRLIVVPPGSREQADAICQSLVAGGYDRCWVKAY